MSYCPARAAGHLQLLQGIGDGHHGRRVALLLGGLGALAQRLDLLLVLHGVLRHAIAHRRGGRRHRGRGGAGPERARARAPASWRAQGAASWMPSSDLRSPARAVTALFSEADASGGGLPRRMPSARSRPMAYSAGDRPDALAADFSAEASMLALGTVVVVRLGGLLHDAARVLHGHRLVVVGHGRLGVALALGLHHLVDQVVVLVHHLLVRGHAVREGPLRLLALGLRRLVGRERLVVPAVGRVFLARCPAHRVTRLEPDHELVHDVRGEHHRSTGRRVLGRRGGRRRRRGFGHARRLLSFRHGLRPAADFSFFLSPPNCAAAGVEMPRIRSAHAAARTRAAVRPWLFRMMSP